MLPILRLLAPTAITAAALALVGLAGTPVSTRPNPAGAAATGLSVPQCIQVDEGETFDVDIFVSDVSQLLAWDILYAYNHDVAEVVDKDVRRLLELLPNSNVLDVSDPLPNSTGIYRLGAADTGGPDAAESGSGILASLTLKAKQKGTSWSTVYRGDVDGNGTTDLGPTLSSIGGAHIGDVDGDGWFDGPITSGQIAVDTDCADTVPTPPPPRGVVLEASPTVGASSAPIGTTDSGASPGTATAATRTPQGTGSATTTPTPTPRLVGVGNQPGGGDSGISFSTWLIGVLAASAAIGVVLSYIIYKTARRPA